MKPFKNIDEQIEILRHRNLKFKDVEKAKKYLLYNNYYNVINCYSKFFLDSYEKYFEETDFEDITSVHHFDKEIKSVLFKYIIEAEKTFKSVFAYRYSDYFKKYNYAYLDINNYTLEKKLEISRFIAELSNIITKNINFNKQNSISHYIKKHKNVPLWVLINYMTFGQISKLYRYMPEKLKNKENFCFLSIL